MNSVRVVIFAKAPLAGAVKTRLIPALGAGGAAALAGRLLQHAIVQAEAADLGPTELCVSPGPDDAAWQTWRVPHVGLWSDQGAGDLGERMARAAKRVLAGAQAILLTGTDCPQLDATHLREAAAELLCHDACLIPAHDGGYVLLGLRRFDSSLFSDMAWSTSHVARETLERMTLLGWSVRVFPPLHDIDEPDDLRWLAGHFLPTSDAEKVDAP